MSRAGRIGLLFVLAVGVVFVALRLKTSLMPGVARPAVSAQMVQALEQLEREHERSQEEIDRRLGLIGTASALLDLADKAVAAMSAELSGAQQQSLRETIVMLELQLRFLDADDRLNRTTLTRLNQVIGGLKLGQPRSELETILDQLSQAIEVQKEGFSRADLSLSSLVSRVQLMPALFPAPPPQDVQPILTALQAAAETSVMLAGPQKETVLANEVSWRVLKKTVDQLPIM